MKFIIVYSVRDKRIKKWDNVSDWKVNCKIIIATSKKSAISKFNNERINSFCLMIKKYP